MEQKIPIAEAVKNILDAKRRKTEIHIRQLEKQNRAGVRYTATLCNRDFLICGVLCDAGWITWLLCWGRYFSHHGLHDLWDGLFLAVTAALVTGVTMVIVLSFMHEKEMPTRLQKTFSFDLAVYSGLAGALLAGIRFFQEDHSSALAGMGLGALVYFVTGWPIVHSFRKGIVYGIGWAPSGDEKQKAEQKTDTKK